MQKFMNLVEASYNSIDGSLLNDLVDVENAAAYIMTNMCLGNMDFGVRSRYCYKDRGQKLRYSPVWDLDIAMGSLTCPDDPTGWQNFQTWSYGDFARYYLQYEWFRSKAMQAYNNLIRPSMARIVSEFDQRTQELSESGAMNDIARRIQKYTPEGSSIEYDLRTFQQDRNILKNWLVARLQWLDQVLSNEQSFRNSLSQYIDGI